MIHELALVDPSAEIADDVEIGPWTMVGQDVVIGAGSWVGAHAVIRCHTHIGKHNKIHSFASIGDDPQHADHRDENTKLIMGDHNIVREYCSINRGTVEGGGVTQIGDHNFFMGYTHVAHDCNIGHHTIFVNNASVAGHVTVGDYAILSAFTGVHQFCTIGQHAFVSRASILTKDVPPYVLVAGNPSKVGGLNRVGLMRRGFSKETLVALREAYDTVYREGHTAKEAVAALGPLANEHPEVKQFVDAVAHSTRGIVR